MRRQALTPFGKYLDDALTARKWSVSELARRVGVTRVTATGWLRGSQPTWDNCEKIAEVLDVPAAEIRKRAGYVLDEDYVHIPGWAELPTEAQEAFLESVAEARRMAPRESVRDDDGSGDEASGIQAG